MSDPVIVSGCGEPIYGVAITPSVACPPFYYSQQIIGNCPMGYSGGPFTLPARKFTSAISQADADAQAATYMATLLTNKCVLIPPAENFSLVFGDATDLGNPVPSFYTVSLDGALAIPAVPGTAYTFANSARIAYTIVNNTGLGADILQDFTVTALVDGMTVNTTDVSFNSVFSPDAEVSVFIFANFPFVENVDLTGSGSTSPYANSANLVTPVTMAMSDQIDGRTNYGFLGAISLFTATGETFIST